MPDLVVVLSVTPDAQDSTKAQFLFTQNETQTVGWSVDSGGNITPPLTGPGSGSFELLLQASGASFAGFNVAPSPVSMPVEKWASVARLAEHHLTPTSPSPWPSSGTVVGQLELTLDYGIPKPSPGEYSFYRLQVKIGDRIYSDDPKIYTDPVT